MAREANLEMLMTASHRSRFRFQPSLEYLEDRLIPTVSYHGGALLPHVEVQGLYLGSDWYYNSTYYNQTGQFEDFNRFLPQSSYMDLLTQLGYGVGRGSTSSGTIDVLALNKSYSIRVGLESECFKIQRELSNQLTSSCQTSHCSLRCQRVRSRS